MASEEHEIKDQHVDTHEDGADDEVCSVLFHRLHTTAVAHHHSTYSERSPANLPTYSFFVFLGRNRRNETPRR